MDIDNDCKTNSNENNTESTPNPTSQPRKRRRVFRNFHYEDKSDHDDEKSNYPSTKNLPSPELSASSATPEPMAFRLLQQQQQQINHQQMASKPRKKRVFRHFQYVEYTEEDLHDDNKDESNPELSASPETPEPNAFHLLQQQQQMNHQQMAPKRDTAITSIVFDYDDTLFPTQALKQIFSRKKVIDNKIVHDSIQNCSQYSYQGLLARASPQELEQLEKLSMTTYQMLCFYLNQYSNNNIVIVSSACKSWMKHSLSILLNIGVYKAIYELLYINPCTKIEIYNPSNDILPFKTCDQISKWKYDTFEKLLNNAKSSYNFCNNLGYNIIHGFVSIGDGEYENEAAKLLRDNEPKKDNAFIHRIKLRRHPQINDLIDQQSQLAQICGIYEMYCLNNKQQIDINYDN